MSGLREGPSDVLLADRVFDNAINVAIAATKDAYERMMFREALKAAAYDLGNARDIYRCVLGMCVWAERKLFCASLCVRTRFSARVCCRLRLFLRLA